jgi:hypothetical protein
MVPNMLDLSRRDFLKAGAGGALALAGVPALAQYVYPSYPKPGEPLRKDVDGSRRIVPAPPKDYWPYAGTSGPGAPVTAETARGGWTSGMPNVRYKGPVPRTYPTAPWGDADAGTAVTRGLLPDVKPLWDVHIRDTIICLGGDGNYYMTGSTGDNIWALNDGVELWRSPDLKRWDYLGLVWSIERDGSWEKNWTMRAGVPFRAIWAPEIHYIAGKYVICTSISGVGMGILVSSSGKAEGPYVHAISADQPIKGNIDSTLFEDDDGRIYLTYGSAQVIREIARDFSRFVSDWVPIVFDEPDLNPDHHRGKDEKALRQLGYEGATLFKANGKYYLGCCDRFYGRYSFAFAIADKIHGPYRQRHEGAPCGGGGNVFRDKAGRWWQTLFGNDDWSPFREKPGIVAIEFDSQGRVVVAKNQPRL